MSADDNYCWCGTRVKRDGDQWRCPAHGYQQHLYRATPLIRGPHIIEEVDRG